MFLITIFSLVQTVLAFTPNSASQIQQQQHVNAAVVAAPVVDQDRRSFLSTIAVGTAAASFINPLIANAEDEDTGASKMSLFKDSNVGFQLQIPSNWKKSEQKLPDRRRLTLFINENDESSSSNSKKGPEDLIFVAYTPVRDDFTSLASFGSVEMVGQATILPKGELAGEDTDNKMLQSESKKNAYYFDYTSKAPNQPKRHFRTIFTLVQGATGGAGSVLVTITAQTLESRYDAAMQSTFDEIINSYKRL